MVTDLSTKHPAVVRPSGPLLVVAELWVVLTGGHLETLHVRAKDPVPPGSTLQPMCALSQGASFSVTAEGVSTPTLTAVLHGGILLTFRFTMSNTCIQRGSVHQVMRQVPGSTVFVTAIVFESPSRATFELVAPVLGCVDVVAFNADEEGVGE